MTTIHRWASELHDAEIGALKRVLVCSPPGVDHLPFENRLLEERYAVTVVHSAAECVNLAYEVRPHAIFVERSMPGLNGEQIRDLLRNDPRTAHATIALLNEPAS